MAAAGGRESLRAEAARRAVSLYRVRVERGEALGYTRAESVRFLRQVTQLEGAVVTSGGGVVEVTAKGPTETSRLGDRLHDQRALVSGEMAPAEFQAKWRWRQLLGVRLSGNADEVLVAYRQGGSELVDVRYQRRGRP